jgi:Mg/Co/Ni transporter MgtE
MVPLHYTDPTVQLNVQAERLSRLHTADLAAILSDMSLGERSRILDSFDDEMVADIIEEFEPNEQAEMLEAIDDDRVADVVGKMEPDDAADMLQVLSPEETADILLHMEEDEAADVRELMEHEPDSAGGIMTSEFIALSADLTVEEALAELREQALELPPENTYNIYLVDADQHLKGATNLRDVLMAEPTAPIADIMNDHPVHAHVTDDREDAARMVARYDLLALPVLEDGHLAGIITVDDALDVLLPPEWKEYFPREHH